MIAPAQQTAVVYSFTNRGLFSELNNLLNAKFFADVKGFRFRIVDSRLSMYFPNGLGEFFEPIGDAILPNEKQLVIRGKSKVFKQIRRFCRKSLTFKQKFQLAKILKLNAKTLAKVNAKIEQMHLPESYCSAHVRWGDKLVREAAQFHAPEYLQKLPRNCKNLFVMTDDYESLREFEDFGISVYSFATEKQKGHSASERRGSGFSRDEVVQLLCEVVIATKSDTFVGTMSSNVSRFVALRRESLKRCVSLDKSWHPL